MEKIEKLCTTCGETKLLEDYYNSRASKDGKGWRCKACDNAAGIKYKSTQDPKRMSRLNRDRMVRYKYNLERHEFDKMIKEQNHVCAICGKQPEPTSIHKGLVIDHCHNSDKVRGLLCAKCNQGLGLLGDSYETLLKAARYLKKHKSIH